MTHVLIVDANLTSRLLLTGLLEEAGCRVAGVADAAAAIDRLGRSEEAIVVVVRAAAEPDGPTRRELAAVVTRVPHRALLWVDTSARRDVRLETPGEITVPLDVPILLAAIQRAAEQVEAAYAVGRQRPEWPVAHLAG